MWWLSIAARTGGIIVATFRRRNSRLGRGRSACELHLPLRCSVRRNGRFGSLAVNYSEDTAQCDPLISN
jgi:hypothetical protein